MTTAVNKNKKFRLSENIQESLVAYLFILPAALLWVIWFLYPVLKSGMMSLQEVNYINADLTKFIGFDNYIRLFKDPYFYRALKNTVSVVVVIVPIQTIIALVLATVLNSKLIKGKQIFRTIYYTPYIISPIAVATVFMYFFVQDTFMTKMLANIGLSNTTWFADVKLAMPFIIIIYIWQMVGFYMVMFLSGLQTIPQDVYEAAAIDGASTLQKFRFVTVPLLKNVTFMVVTYGMIQAFQMFDQIVAVSTRNGGLGSPAGATSTMVTFFYQQSFNYREMGYGSAAAIVFVLIIFVVTVIQKAILGKEEA